MAKNAIIIGAGPAGLTAAYTLLTKTNIHPIILEETDMVGGIAQSISYQGNRVDLGGHRFFSKNQDIMNLWQEILPLENESEKNNILLKRNRLSRIFYLKKFFDYPISLKYRTFANLGFKRTFFAGLGYLQALFHKKPENSLENFYINRFGKQLYKMFFEHYTTKVWGRHPSQISAEWGAQRVKGLSLMKAVYNALFGRFIQKKETSLIDSFYYPKLGCGQMWESMAEEIIKKGGEIRKNTPVKSFKIIQNKITAVILDNNQEISGDFFLSSMPVKDLVLGIPDTPKNVQELAQNLPYRDFITVALLIDKTKEKSLQEIKDNWIYIQEENVHLGRLQIFNNWSPYMVKNPDKTVWMGLEYFCNEGDELWTMTDENFIQMAITELSSIGLIKKENVLDATRIKVKKAYPAYFDSYEHFDIIKSYLNSFENLYCIGRNGQHRYNNMDHSMLTAISAVECIQGQKTKEELWNVNAEKEYHEEKKN